MDMAEDTLNEPLDEDYYVCGLCKSVFNSLQVFSEHKRLVCGSILGEDVCTTIEPPSTIIADTNSENPSPTVHPTVTYVNIVGADVDQEWPKEYGCFKCKKRFRKKDNWRMHMKMHHDNPYQCPICGRCSNQKSHLQAHIECHKMWPDSFKSTAASSPSEETASYSCSFCLLTFPNYSRYRSHLKHHASLKKYKCVQWDCMEFHDTVENLLEHVATDHINPVYSCHVCSAHFDNLPDIATHQFTHNDPEKDVKYEKVKAFKCSLCDAKFSKEESLSQHMVNENHKRTCIHCKKVFANDKRLRLHLHTHKKRKLYQCDICDSSFHIRNYLATHMLSHGVKQFECDICSKTFKRRDVLSRHIQIHQSEKRFICPFKDSDGCEKQFSRRDKLKSHIKYHTKPKRNKSQIKNK